MARPTPKNINNNKKECEKYKQLNEKIFANHISDKRLIQNLK
jgi:hypothetical protein